MAKPFLIIQPATSHDDLPALCEVRGDEIAWFSNACQVPRDEIQAIRVYEGEPLPDPADIRAAVITGAIDMVTDPKPWIRDLADWTRRAVAAEVPLLGVCFGHQMLAYAMGGEVGENLNGPMFGPVAIQRLECGRDDPLFGVLPDAATMRVFHFQSVLTMPDSAEVLVSAAHDPHHAARYGPAAWGVQFHPEFDRQIMDSCYDVYGETMTEAGFSVDALRAAEQDSPAGFALLQKFADLSRP